MKYAQRYGKRMGRNRADLLKVIHYGLFMLHVHDKAYKGRKIVMKISNEHEKFIEKLFNY